MITAVKNRKLLFWKLCQRSLIIDNKIVYPPWREDLLLSPCWLAIPVLYYKWIWKFFLLKGGTILQTIGNRRYFRFGGDSTMTELSLKSGSLSNTWTLVHWCWGCFNRQWGVTQTWTFLSPKQLCWEKADSLLKLEESGALYSDLRRKWFCRPITCWRVYFIHNILGTVK